MVPWTVCKYPTLRFAKWPTGRHHRTQILQAHACNSHWYQLPHELHSLEQNHNGQCPDMFFHLVALKPSRGQEPSERRTGASISDLRQPCQVSLEQIPFSYVSCRIRGFRMLDAGLGHLTLCISHRDWLTAEPIQSTRKEVAQFPDKERLWGTAPSHVTLKHAPVAMETP